MNVSKYFKVKALSSVLVKKSALVAFIAIMPFATMTQATETISITGQKLGCAGCVTLSDFMDSYGGGYPEEDEQDDDMMEEWEDQREAKWLKKCNADVTTKVKECKDGVTTGGYWLGGTFCVSTAVVATFFTSPLGGAFYGTACGGVANALVSEAQKACEAGGVNLKAEKCVTDNG